MKRHETADEIMEVDKTKKRNVGLTKSPQKLLKRSQHQSRNAFDEQTENDDSDFRLFADWAKKYQKEIKKLRARRLGIFKFGSRAAKLPDAQG